MMLQSLVFVLFTIQSLGESPIQKLESFFTDARNKVIEMNQNYRKIKPSKPDKQHILFKPKKYKMNMQDSVETRWSSLCDEYTTNYTTIYHYLNDVIESSGAADILYNDAMEWFNKYVSDPYKSEIEYFATCTKIPLQGVVMIQLMELFFLFGCTSIACSDANDNIIFARNFDVWLLDIQDEIRSVLIDVQYKSGKDILFEGYSFFGYSGIIAGAKKDGYSVAVNSRYSNSISDCFSVLKNDGNIPFSWLIRDTLSNYNKYETALHQFKTVPIATPCYFTIGGTTYPQAAVITRNYTDCMNPFYLETSYLDWFVVQTNDDWWKDATDGRRNDAIQNMKLMGQNNANEKHIVSDVLSQFETINFGTVAQTTMVPSGNGKSVYKTVVVAYHSYQPVENNIETNNAQIRAVGTDTFVNSFENMWNEYVGIGTAIFAASIFFNIVMCIYWSASYTTDSNHNNNNNKVTKIIISESESDETDETELSERDDEDL